MAQKNQNTNELSITQKGVVDLVEAKVLTMAKANMLHLPPDYSAANAMKSAWLILQETQAKSNGNYVPALDHCTKNSVANSLLYMCVRGLNPMKKQCYFIPYGNKLSCQESYFGAIKQARAARPDMKDIFHEVVYEGDEFKYTIKRGQKIVLSHEQNLANVDRSKIVAAYCEIVSHDDQVIKTCIMAFDEIKQSWKMSKMNPVNDKGTISPGSTHEKYTADMCGRTVMRKACKMLVNTSDDADLFATMDQVSSQIQQDQDLSDDMDQNANKQEINPEQPETQEPEIVDEPTETAPADPPAEEEAPFA